MSKSRDNKKRKKRALKRLDSWEILRAIKIAESLILSINRMRETQVIMESYWKRILSTQHPDPSK